jgi:hypothetical protein
MVIVWETTDIRIWVSVVGGDLYTDSVSKLGGGCIWGSENQWNLMDTFRSIRNGVKIM